MKPRPSSRNPAHRHLAAHFQIVALRLPTGRPLTSNFHACQFQWSEIRKRHVRTVRGASGGGGPLRHPGGPDRGTTPGRQDHACPEDGGRGPDLRHARRADGATGFIRGLDKAIIDDIQRAPHLLLAIKKTVDEDYGPGRFRSPTASCSMTAPISCRSATGWPRRHCPLCGAERLQQSARSARMRLDPPIDPAVGLHRSQSVQ